MGRLRLKQPIARNVERSARPEVAIEVSVKVPAPHLDGIYSYRAYDGEVVIGSAVQVPFGSEQTNGFVVGVNQGQEVLPTLKRVTKVVEKGPLFDRRSLDRYLRISDLYGVSLYVILALATSSWQRGTFSESTAGTNFAVRTPSEPDEKYLQGIFGRGWQTSARNHLLLEPGILWERVALSLFLASEDRTLILLPTERHLSLMRSALEERGVRDYVMLSGSLSGSERSKQFARLVKNSPQLFIGTRTAALAPFDPKLVIIIDPGDENYLERRAPFHRADEIEIWHGVERIVSISHHREINLLARGEAFLRPKSKGRHKYSSTSRSQLLTDLRRALEEYGRSATVLISYNDKSFASSLICTKCRNRAFCECGFPLRIPHRGVSPRCGKCQRIRQAFVCRFCGGDQVLAQNFGSEAVGASIAKSIQGSIVILSSADAPKTELKSGNGITLVIATQGSEPRMLTNGGDYRGYDVVALLGGRAAFTSPSLRNADRFRLAWSRVVAHANLSRASILVDIDPIHPEFFELRGSGTGRGLERVVDERKELQLPPFATIVELRGEERVLQRLRTTFEDDPLFKGDQGTVFPVHDGKMMLKVNACRRMELIRLLREMTRLRSARRLPPVSYRIDPDDF